MLEEAIYLCHCIISLFTLIFILSSFPLLLHTVAKYLYHTTEKVYQIYVLLQR